MAGRKSFFLFLMGLAWNVRYSMPLLLSGTVALLGRAWMFQIRVQTVNRLNDPEMYAYFDDDDDDGVDENRDERWETDSNGSWETIVEEVAYG